MKQANVLRGPTWTAMPSGNGTGKVLQESLQGSFWGRLRSYFRWESLTVAGREVKGWIVPQPLGIALIILTVGGIGSLYWRMSDKIQDQHDLIIRMDQRLADKNDRDKEFREELKKQVDDKLLIVDSRLVVSDKRLANLEAKQ